ncbi:hypothetical protein SLA_4361 [Streptomyces laurentii]|uniref:DUF664 domain-containing protein n=1 Tax=Streptomyces laurentii TaxID=39478 RepID=A0A160P1G1_STRLU|nr:hypothetical protein SLA_4361 [Streptomyces laurentii]
MKSAELLLDAFGRIQEAVHEAVEGLSVDELAVRVDPDANSIGWLVWHLTRVTDDHLADAFDTGQAWTGEDWSGRFGLPFPDGDVGFGHDSAQVAAVRADAGLLLGYHDAVHARVLDQVGSVTAAGLDRVVDTRWTPHVTLGPRLISLVAEGNQHAGQAAYIRGIVERRRTS